MQEVRFEWIDFYQEFADILLRYQTERALLIAKIKQVFQQAGLPLPSLDTDNQVDDIDPFTIFGLFNKSSQKTQNRIALLSVIASQFSLVSTVPQSFEGIPVINNLAATFYRFKNERSPRDIDSLWNLFKGALAYADEKTENNRTLFLKNYDIVRSMKGIKWNITMGLFWIRPEAFLSLDSRNRWFLFENGAFPDDFIQETKQLVRSNPPSGAEYLKVTEACRKVLSSGSVPFKTFPALSFQSWVASEAANRQKETDLTDKNATDEEDPSGQRKGRNVRYWLYSPGENAKYWEEFYQKGIMAIGWNVGDLSIYPDKDAIRRKIMESYPSELNNATNTTWQFSRTMSPGDVIFVKEGKDFIVGRGIVTSEYFYDKSRKVYLNVRQVQWTDKGRWVKPAGKTVLKTLTDITSSSEYVDKLEALFEKNAAWPVYTDKDFLKEAYLNQNAYDELVDLAMTKKNLILEGAPGVVRVSRKCLKAAN